MQQFAVSLLMIPKSNPHVGEMLTFQDEEEARKGVENLNMDKVAALMGRDECIYLN